MNEHEEKYLTMKNALIDENSAENSKIKNYEKSTHFVKLNISTSQSENVNVSTKKITMICRRCNVEFYFNNKLHKHLKICNKQIPRKIQKTSIHMTISNMSMIEFTNKRKNFHEFVFRTHHYATIKGTLTS